LKSMTTADLVLGRGGWSGRNWLRGVMIMARIPRKFLIETAEVDLNPIRAKVAATPETSRFTSVFERIQAEREKAASESVEKERVVDAPRPLSLALSSEGRGNQPLKQARSPEGRGNKTLKPARCRGSRAEWLSPLPLADEVADERRPVPACRASNKGCLPMSLADYLRLLDWTGRQLRRDKRGAIPSDVAPILERLKVTDDGWLHLVKDFSRMFRRAAGTPATLGLKFSDSPVSSRSRPTRLIS
jgi:hypothetical protein